MTILVIPDGRDDCYKVTEQSIIDSMAIEILHTIHLITESGNMELKAERIPASRAKNIPSLNCHHNSPIEISKTKDQFLCNDCGVKMKRLRTTNGQTPIGYVVIDDDEPAERRS